MLVREYKPEDLREVVEMFQAQGFEYDFPDLGDPIFVSKLVAENGQGKPAMCFAARLTAESYLLLDPRAGTPQQRWDTFLTLHRLVEQDLARKGLDDLHAWLPPGKRMERFGRRLETLGWVRDNRWVPYCLYLRQYGGQNGQR